MFSKLSMQRTLGSFFTALALGLLSTSGFGGVGSTGTGRVAYGAITDFGSIFVNGIEFSTSGANIIISGNSNRPESELRRGMAVRVEGTINPDGKTGTATVVEFAGDIEGTVDAAPVISGSGGTFTVYGLVVKTDSKTVYENVSGLSALVAGNVVEVSGFFNANDGSFEATRVERQPAFRKVELRGLVKNPNTAAKTFQLGSLTVNYANARAQDIPSAGYVAGQLVEVKSNTAPSGGVLNATRAEVDISDLDDSNVAFGLLTGIAAKLPSSSSAKATPATFEAGNQQIQVTAQTIFIGGTQAHLVNGVKITANGPVVNGVLTAEEIIFAAGCAVTAVSGDDDGDGIPNAVETGEGKNACAKDNDVFNDNRLFVMQQHRDFVGREANAGEIAAMVGALAGGATRGALIEQMLNTPEHFDLYGPIVRLYQAYFLRTPDQGGNDFWVTQYKNRPASGWSFEGISEFFSLSPEFQQRYGALNTDQFVTLIYRNVLNRDPEPGGFAFWKDELNSGRRIRGNVMAAFSESPENKLKTKGAVQVVTLHSTLLKREVDPAVLAQWAPAIDGGASIRPLIDQLIAKPEYRARFLP